MQLPKASSSVRSMSSEVAQDPQIIEEIVKLKLGLAECQEAKDLATLKIQYVQREVKILKSQHGSFSSLEEVP